MDHSLATYICEGPADSSVLQIFRRVLEALNAIHAAGVSHPPLSPETIRLNDFDQPQIETLNRPHESADTVAFGSVKYCAPEAFADSNQSSSCELVDSYVLSFIFYEILIGKRLFAAQFAALENGPPSLWVKWHGDKTPKARSLTELRPNLGHFARLIDGMMEKDPGKRITIPQVLTVFSNVEAQTAQKTDPWGVPAAAPRPLHRPARAGKKLASTVARFGNQLAALRKLPVAAGLGVLLLALAFITLAILVNREAPSRRVQQPAAAAPPPSQSSPGLSTKAPVNSVLPSTPAPKQDAESQPSVPPDPESELQVESHLTGRSFLLLDNLGRVALRPDALFREKIVSGLHTLKVVTHSSSFLQLPLNIRSSGDITFLGHPEARSLRYVVLAYNAKSAKLYGPEARAALPGQSYEPVPEEGQTIANNQVVTVSFGQNPKKEVRVAPLPAGSIRVVLEPGERTLLVPVEISSNVLDADILINGEKLRRKLDRGARRVRLPVGEYRVKLVHAGYQDSAEQELIVSDNERQRQLRFTLLPIAGPSTSAISSVLGHELGTDGAAVNVRAQAMRPLGRVTFHVLPDSARITCRREGDSQTQDCLNNQPCLLRPGAYEVTAKAGGFKAKVNHVAVENGDEKPYEWKLEAIQSALNPADFFEDGQNWTVDENGWWSHNQLGCSFMRAVRGTFVFDILKPSGLFVTKKVSLVVNYRGEEDRVLYTIGAYRLYRNERAPGFQTADYSIAHHIPAEANYRLTLELRADRVIIRNHAGKTLDNLLLANAAGGKAGFLGKVKLKIIQAEFPQYAENSEHLSQ